MSYKALYRKYRPDSFEEVAGQKHVVQTLTNAIHQNKLSHAYLFCGPRGTGKTSIAKLFAKGVNCTHETHKPCGVCESCQSIAKGTHPDVIEIDAASNNGVEEIRTLIEKVKYAPIESKYKVYIIDEVHMMSKEAFNAFLKTLEEPPTHVIFILCTTDPQKILPTILSRCQRYDFTKVALQEIETRIHKILKLENLTVSDGAVRLVAQLSEGGMRDALSILDQCIAYAQDNITEKEVHDIYGITTTQEKCEMINRIFHRETATLLNQARELNDRGMDIQRLNKDLIDLLKELVIYSYTHDTSLLTMLTEEEAQQMLVDKLAKECLALIDVLMETAQNFRFAANVYAYFEVALLKLVSVIDETDTPAQRQVMQQATTVQKEVPHFHSESALSTSTSSTPVSTTPSIKEEMKQEIPTSTSSVPRTEETPVEIKSDELPDFMGSSNVSQVNEPIPVRQSVDPAESMDFAGYEPEDSAMEESEDFAEPMIESEESAEVQEPTESATVPTEQLTDEFILSLLVQGDKQMRQTTDGVIWHTIANKCMDMNWARQANLLNGTDIKACNQDFILISSKNSAMCRQINEKENNCQIYQFCKEVLGLDKMVYALCEQDLPRIFQLFKERAASNSLPEKAVIVRYQDAQATSQEKQPEKSDEEKLIDLFGIDQLEIVEE